MSLCKIGINFYLSLWIRICFILTQSIFLAACDNSLEIHAKLSERDANEIVAALYTEDIKSRKGSTKLGYNVVVDESQLSKAILVLKKNGLPRQSYTAMGEIFKKDGAISTPMEERGRYLFALSQELERTLSQINGVILARVHPVLPERVAVGTPLQPSSCAVLIKHQPGWNSSAYEMRIRQLVLASIPGLAAGGGAISIVFVSSESEEAENELLVPIRIKDSSADQTNIISNKINNNIPIKQSISNKASPIRTWVLIFLGLFLVVNLACLVWYALGKPRLWSLIKKAP